MSRPLTRIRCIESGKPLLAYDPVWGGGWDSISYNLSTDLGCHPDDLALKQIEYRDNDYEVITVCGEPVAYVERAGYPDFNAVRAAAFPQEQVNLLAAG